jgi:hypothetical protein
MIFVRFHHMMRLMRATLCTDNCRSHQSEAPSTARYARRGVERGHGLLRTEVTELWGGQCHMQCCRTVWTLCHCGLCTIVYIRGGSNLHTLAWKI